MSLRRSIWLSLTIILALALTACGAKPTTEAALTAAAPPTAEPATAAPTSAPGAPATTTSAGKATDDPEPNTPEEALAIEAGATTGSLIDGDEDWFTIGVPAGGILNVALTHEGGTGAIEFAIQDEDGVDVYHEYNIVKAAATKEFNHILSGAAGAEFALLVAGGPGEYTLEVTIDGQEDAGSGKDAGDEPASAMPITAGKAVTGIVGDEDSADLFRLDTAAGTVLSLSVSSTDGSNKEAALLDADQYDLWREYTITTEAKSTTQILSHADADIYYVWIAGDKGAYAFEVTAEPQDDAGSGKDAGDQPESAIAVELGKSYSGLIGVHDTYDLYTFQAKGGDILNLTFTPAGDAEGISVAVMDPDEYEMWAEYGAGPGSAKTFSHVLDATAGGTYYVAVTGGKGAYTLDLSAASQNDAGSGKDAGDEPASAVAVEPNASYNGQIGGSDAEDVFKFEVDEGEIISLTFTPAEDAEPTSVALWDPDLSELWSEYGVGPGVSKLCTYVVGADLGGTYYVWVGDAGEQDRYAFEVQVSRQDDAGSGGDAGDTPGAAVDVEPDNEFSGLVGDEDTDDYYRFEPEAGQTVVITNGPEAEPLYAGIYDGDEDLAWEQYDIPAGDTVEYEIEAVDGETPYYLQLWGARGTYTVLIEPAP